MSESITFIVDAENRANAKLKAASQEVQRTMQTVDRIGTRVGESADSFGQLTQMLEGLGVSGAGELSSISDQVSQFSQVANQGGRSGLMLKAGLVAATAAISVNVGRAIGDVIFQTEAMNRKLEASRELFNSLADQTLKKVSDRFNRTKEDIEAFVPAINQEQAWQKLSATVEKELSGVGMQIDSTKKKIQAMREDTLLWMQSDNHQAEIQLQEDILANAERQRDVLRAQREELRARNSERARALALARDQTAAEEKSNNIIQSMRRELRLLEASGENRLRLELQYAGVRQQDMMRAMAIRRLQEQERKKQEAAAQAESERVRQQEQREMELVRRREQAARERERQQQRIADLNNQTFQSIELQVQEMVHGKEAARAMALQMQGMDANSAAVFARAEQRLSLIKRLQQSTVPKSGNQVEEARFGVGKIQANFEKTQQDIESQKQTALATAANGLLEQLVALMSKPNGPKFMIKGDR